MNKFLAVLLLVSTNVFAHDYGRVVEVTEDYEYRTICEDVRTYHYDQRHNRDRINISGAIIGGLIGSQIGNGSGRDAAIAAGAVIGSQYNRPRHYRRHHDRFERRCHQQRYFIGYVVTYEHHDRYYTARMSRHPGRYVDLRDW